MNAKELAEWLLDEYPFFYPADEDELEENIQNNILDGWIPYIVWYNKEHKNKITFPTDPQDFIERVLHKSIEKCGIPAPKVGQEIKDYKEG